MNYIFSKKNYSVFLLIIWMEISLISNQSIAIPYQIYNPTNKESTKEKILDSIENVKFYSFFEIGNPPMQIPIFYNFYNSSLSFHSNLSISSALNSTYNPSNSKTFKNLENKQVEEELTIITENGKITDNFIFLNETKKEKGENLFGQIGLQNFYSEYILKIFTNPNFFYQLKTLGLIDHISFSINQTSENGGFININKEPNDYAPKLYSDKEQYKYTTYVKGVTSKAINKYGEYLWNMEINLVYYENYENKMISISEPTYDKYGDDYSAILNPLYGAIKAPYSYKNLIDIDFFNHFTKNKICFNSLEHKKEYYYCNANYKKELKEKFPTLYFYHHEFNYTFELDFEDLFYENNNYLYFMICFDTGMFGDDKFTEISEWILGRPFLNKFQFSFDIEKKRISFYKNINGYLYHHAENKNINKYLYVNQILSMKNFSFISFSIFIIFVVSFCISYYIKKERKKVVKQSKFDKFKKSENYIELKEELNDINY